MRRLTWLTLLLAAATSLSAQEPPAPPAPPAPAGSGAPSFNIYLPEGEVSLRIRRLIKNVLFEAQGNYKFVDGDISTFLRYKYYAHTFAYKLSLFDSIEFADITSTKGDFDRIRGILTLFEYPKNYNNRFFLGVTTEKLNFGDIARADNGKRNNYAKLGYQFGTPFDERMNSIVGESRGRIIPVLTAYRDVGPQKTGLAVGLTQSGGDFTYTKLESEVLKRFDITTASFLVTRMHVGSIFKNELDAVAVLPEAEKPPEEERYSVPRYELFKLGGREALKGIKDRLRGSDEIHLTGEYFVPIFRNRDYQTWVLHWTTLYGIGYLGAGNLGFDPEVLTKVGDYVVDAGVGVEAALAVRDLDVLLTVVYARPFTGVERLRGGGEIRFAVRTSR